MSRMQIHCPGCGTRLEVPSDAGGRSARCPTCRTRFRVPEPRAMLDETVACWLDLDHLHDDEEREEAIEQMQQRGAAVERAQTLDEDHPDSRRDAAEPRADAAGEPNAPDAADESAALAAPDPEGADEQGPAVRPRGAGSFVVDVDPPAAPAGAGKAPATPRSQRGQLQVVHIGTAGVKMRFFASCLDNPNFRASMPMRGMISGQTDPTQLVARPLAWVDKATGHFTNPGEIEARYELHPKPQQTPREVAATMATINELPPPFNQPMPWYAGRDETGKVKVHCETFATPAGVMCEVTIPTLRYALDWLGRVNGVCGDDYAQLEAQTLKYEAQAWRAIPHNVRHRLAVWFDFAGDERFLGYFNDSDFSKADAGLAGLVVTTRRIVWCKYHHHGTLALDQPGTLHAHGDGRFADLAYESGGESRKLVRLRLDDAEALGDLLAKLGVAMRFDIEQQTQPPGGARGDPADVRVSE